MELLERVVELSLEGYCCSQVMALLLLELLGEEEPLLVDDLVDRTQLPARRVLSALTVLEMEHLVTQHSGKRYTRAVTLYK